MSKQYVCDLCKKQFIQKIDLTRHQNKKNACITVAEMEKIIKEKENTTSQNTLSNALKSYLNILRDNEGMVGDKALRNISYLLILKLIEPHIGNTIKLEEYPFNFNHVDPGMLDTHKSKLFSIAKFSNLVLEKEESLFINIKILWDDILSMHPATEKIFLNNSGFDIQKQSTLKILVNKIHNLDLSNISFDILGHAYEDVIQSIMIGKTLGQFFTPVPVKKMMINLINPQIRPDGKFETCGEPSMGTAGFLTSYLQYILKQAKEKNIQPDWNFIRTEGLYGNEINSDTFQLAMANLLISSGHIFDQMDCGDSIRKMITRKFEVVLANPPFGIKGLKYDDFNYPNKEKYLPFKINNGSMLFLQLIIYILKVNGRCAVVMPDGQELFSATNAAIIKIRKYLMKTCDLKEVIYLPAQTFTNTAVKTAVLYFTKKRECEEVLTIETKTTKSRTTKKIEFAENYMTTNVKFYTYNPTTEVKTLLGEKSMDEISNHHYTLTFTDTVTEIEIESNNSDIPTKTIGEVCEIKYGTRITKKDTIEGDYPVYGGGDITFTTNNFNREGFNILVSRFGISEKCVRLVDGKIFLNDNGLSIKSKITELNNKYLGYYLISIQNMIYNLSRGSAQKALDIKSFKNISIPIPSLEQQQEIIKKSEEKELFLKSYAETAEGLKKLNKNNMQHLISKNPVTKTLDELFTLNGSGKTNSKDVINTGEYPFYKASHENPSGTHAKYDFDGDSYLLIVKSGGSSAKPISENYGIGKVFLVHGKCAANVAVFQLIPKTENNIKYLYYYLRYLQTEIQKLARYCTNNGNIDMKELMKLKIPIPTLEQQQKIESIGDLIEHLEKEFDQVKKDVNENLKLLFAFTDQEDVKQEVADDYSFLED